MSAVEDLFSVRGKVALVTGAASGLGQAFATVLAGAGAHVVVADVDQFGAEKVAAELGESGSAAAAVLDVSDRAAVDALADKFERFAERSWIDDGLRRARQQT